MVAAFCNSYYYIFKVLFIFVEEELIFNLEDCQVSENNITSPCSNQLNAQSVMKHRPKSPQKNRLNSTKQRHVRVSPSIHIENKNYIFIQGTIS